MSKAAGFISLKSPLALPNGDGGQLAEEEFLSLFHVVVTRADMRVCARHDALVAPATLNHARGALQAFFEDGAR